MSAGMKVEERKQNNILTIDGNALHWPNCIAISFVEC